MAELLTFCNVADTASLLADLAPAEWPSRFLDVFAATAIAELGARGELAFANTKRPAASDLEGYLREHSPRRRAELGVFFTPAPVARYAVKQVHDTLREQFGLPDGLADTTTWGQLSQQHRIQIPRGVDPASPFISILEPAAGDGVFLIAAIDLIHETLRDKWASQGCAEREARRRWNDYVSGLLPRLTAFEILPAACAAAQLKLARRLLDTGYQIQPEDRLACFVVNTLLDPADLRSGAQGLRKRGFNKRMQAELARLRQALAGTTYTVVLGNPPFRGISDNTAPWMQRLLRGEAPGGRQVASYYEVERKPLGERKLWLQDDYVKFLRYAQWQIERAKAGVIGLVTNHGYLDNTTFRGVRHALQQTFDSIDILDLHGNRKKGERHPNGGVDESVFDIEQGVAVGVFSRNFQPRSPVVLYREAWGSRDEKLAKLEVPGGCKPARLAPKAPHFLFIPRDSDEHPEYAAGLPINEVMPVNSTAAVTARDSFVVAFTPEELLARMRVFRDPDVSDDAIRARFFTRGRSNKYPPGDTRGWKLAEARRRMRQDPDWDKHILLCDYRPFDRRAIYWADWMIDWPRSDLMRHLTQRENVALVTRRQAPTAAACDFFWLTDSIVIDGLVRSDNRGSESFFPLFLADGGVNLSEQFIAAVEQAIGLPWNSAADDLPEAVFGPRSAFCYVHALFTSTIYRTRYASELRHGFPRVLLPRDAALWRELAELGSKLVGEVFRSGSELQPGTECRVPSTEHSALTPFDEVVLGRGFPKYEGGAIWLADEGPGFSAPEAVWEYRVGTHQVCRKWLRDRKRLTPLDIAAYERMLGSIASLLALTASIDAVITEAGGPAAAFLA